MYWRTSWNFAGRQNDKAGNNENTHLGNWISGNSRNEPYRLGDQSLCPTNSAKGNKGHNVFYMLPAPRNHRTALAGALSGKTPLNEA